MKLPGNSAPGRRTAVGRRPNLGKRIEDLATARLEARVVPAVITPFTPRYSANANGDITFVANTLMTAPDGNPNAASARDGTGSKLNNNDFNMVRVDVDSDPTTVNSSRASLALPVGGSILWAGLYWGASSSSSGRNSVKFQVPGAGNYTTVAGSVIGVTDTDYHAFADVTSLVKAAGPGSYTVANVQADTGTDRQAGWSIVVAYGDPSAPPRNLTVFDGFAVVDSRTPNVTIGISGFKAPLSGAVNSTVGFVTYEGDGGYTGDSVKLNGTTLSDAQNPADNFFNSTISNRGSLVGAKAPNYANQMGFDADLVSKTGLIANGATSATIALTTGGETYYPGVVTTAFDLYAPVVTRTLSAVDLNGGVLRPGDTIEYTDTITVASGEAAVLVNLTAPIPGGTQYVAGSLSIASGANVGTKTDGPGDDQAEAQAALNQLVFRLGTGANATAGGSIAVGGTATVKYRVLVNATALDGDVIAAQSTAGFQGQSTGASLSATSNLVRMTVVRYEDLALAASVDNATPNVNDTVTLTFRLSNAADDVATGIAATITLPSGLQFVSSTPSLGSYNATTGIWSVGMLDGVGPATLAIRAKMVGQAAVTASAAITAADQPDPVAGNNTASVVVTPLVADLKLGQAVSSIAPKAGQQVTFTTTLTNLGPSAATGVAVAASLPAGFTLVSATPSAGTYAEASGLWTVGGLAANSPVTLTIVATVASATASTFSASVASSGIYDPVAGNNAASVAVAPQQADLAIAKSVDVSRPNVGGLVVLTTRLTNNGPTAASGVSILSPVGPGLTFVGVQADQGGYDSATGAWTVGSVASGGVVNLRVTARVTSASVTISTASVSALDQYDTASVNNSASVSISPQQADLSTSITISDAAPNVGDNIDFTIKLANAGPDAATGVTLRDLLPAGYQFVSSSPSNEVYSSMTGNWTVGSIASGATRTLTIRAKVTSASAGSNAVSVHAADQYDPNAGNNAASVSSSPQQADLALSAAFATTGPDVGQAINYVVTLTSSGPTTATGVKVSVPLPAGLSLVAATPASGTTFNSDAGAWSVGSIAPGASVTLTLAVRPIGIGTSTVVASIAGADQPDPAAANNSATASVTPRYADLALAAAVDKSRPNAGDELAFRITLTNPGPDAATGIAVTHALPASGLAYIGASGPGTYNPLTGVWSLPTLASGASATLTIRASVVTPEARSISATITGSSRFDPVDTNNSVSVSYTPRVAGLSVALSASNDRPAADELVSFLVTLSNAGPDAGTNVRLDTALPPSLAIESFTATSGAFATGTGAWTIGSLGAMESITLTIRARVVGVGGGDAVVTIAAADPFDTPDSDNAAQVYINPLVADLSLTASVDDATPDVGDVVTMTVDLHNAGFDPATGVAVLAAIPAGTAFLSADTGGVGTYDPATGVWSIGDLIAINDASLSLKFRVVEPSVADFVATITATHESDPTSWDRTATVAIDPLIADLGLAATVDDRRPNRDQEVAFTFTLTNAGPSAATGAAVAIPLPAGLTYVDASTGNYDSGTGIWTVGGLAGGTSVTLTIRARVTAATVPAVTASVAADQYDPADANDTASVFLRPRQVDLIVGKTVSDPTPNVGDAIRYTITVINTGNDTATGVVIGDLLPAGMAYVSSSGDGGYDDTAGVWSVGTLAKGAEARLVLVVQVGTGSTTVNTASVAAVDQFDVNAANDSAETSVTPLQSDLRLTGIVDDPAPLIGQVVTYTFSLKNQGKDVATGIGVTLTLPPGLTLVGLPIGTGSYDPVAGVWSPGDLNSLDVATLTVRARVDSTDAQTMTAAITAAVVFDPNASNDSVDVVTRAQVSDLRLGFAIDDARPDASDIVTAYLDLSNAGPDDATNVLANVPIPAGFELISATTAAGSYDPATGLWTPGDTAAGSTVRLVLKLRPIAGDPILLKASVTADQDDPAPDDDNIQAVVAPKVAELGLAASVDVSRPSADQLVTFTLVLTNSGPDDATNIAIATGLPAGLSFVGVTAGLGTFDSGTSGWTIPRLAAGASTTLVVRARVSSPGAATFTAGLSALDQFDTDAEDDAASATVTPLMADLVVLASVDDATPNVGDEIILTFTVTNAGPDDATGVILATTLPPGLTWIDDRADEGTRYDRGGGWTVGELAAHASRTLRIRVRVVDPAAATAILAIVGGDQYDAAPGDRSASVDVAPQSVTLALATTVDRPRPDVGETVTIAVTVTNAGPDVATGVVVLVPLPAGLRLASSPGGYDAATGRWAVGTIAPGATATLVLTAVVADPGVATVSAAIAAVDQFDRDADDNASDATLAPRESGLILSQTLDAPSANPGDMATFTVTLANVGPDDAGNVRVAYVLPAGLTLVGAVPSVGTFDPTTGIWTIPRVAVGAPATLTIRARLGRVATPLDAVATLQGSDTYDPGIGATASASVTANSVDVAVTTTVDVARPDADQVVEFVVTAAISARGGATGLRIAAAIPVGLAFVSADPGIGTYDPSTGVWQVGTVDAPGTVTLRIRARVISADPSTFAASLAAVDQVDVDATDDVGTTTIAPIRADLVVTIDGLPAEMAAGQFSTFRVTVTDRGPDGANGVGLPIALPAGLRLVGSSAARGTFDPTTGLWTIGGIAPGESVTLTLTVEAVHPGDGILSAGPASSSTYDPDPAGDAAVGDVQIRSPQVATPTPTPTDPIAGTTIPATGAVAGVVYLDRTLNGRYDRRFDRGIATIRVVLVGVDSQGHRVRRVTTTAANGTFRFEGVAAGRYTLRERPVRHFQRLRGNLGTAGGNPRAGVVRGLTMAAGADAVGYALGNVPVPGCQLVPIMGRSALGRPLPRGPLIERLFPRGGQARGSQPEG